MPQTVDEKRPFEVVPVYLRLSPTPNVAGSAGSLRTVDAAVH